MRRRDDARPRERADVRRYAVPAVRAVVLTLLPALRKLPFSIRVQSFRLVIRGARSRRIKPHQLASVEAAINASSELANAAGSVGGADAIDASLRYHVSYHQSVSLAHLIGDGRDHAVQVSGRDEIMRALKEGPVIVVQPHLGPPFLPVASLLQQGVRVASLMREDASVARDLLRVLPKLRPDLPDEPLRLIVMPNPSALLQARAALQAGYVLFWQPDAIMMPADGRRTVPGSFLGLPIGLSTFVPDMASRTSAAVFICAGNIRRSRFAPTASVTFSRLSLSGSSAEDARSIYGSAQQMILREIKSWWMWTHLLRLIEEQRGSSL